MRAGCHTDGGIQGLTVALHFKWIIQPRNKKQFLLNAEDPAVLFFCQNPLQQLFNRATKQFITHQLSPINKVR